MKVLQYLTNYVNNLSDKAIEKLSSHPHLTIEIIDKYFDKWKMRDIVFNPSLSSKLIEKYILINKINLKELSKHPNLTIDIFEKYVFPNMSSWNMYHISKHPKMTLSLIKSCFDRNIKLDRTGLIQNPNLTFEFLINNYNKKYWNLNHANYHKLINEDVFKEYFLDSDIGWKIVDKDKIPKHLLTEEILIKYYNLNEEQLYKRHLENLIISGNYTAELAEKNKHIIPIVDEIWSEIILTEEIIDKYWDNKDKDVYLDKNSLSRNETLTTKMIDKYLLDKDGFSSDYLCDNPNMTSELVDKYINHHMKTCKGHCQYNRDHNLETISQCDLITSEMIDKYLEDDMLKHWDMRALSSNEKIEGWLIAKHWHRNIWDTLWLEDNLNTPMYIRKECSRINKMRKSSFYEGKVSKYRISNNMTLEQIENELDNISKYDLFTSWYHKLVEEENVKHNKQKYDMVMLELKYLPNGQGYEECKRHFISMC